MAGKEQLPGEGLEEGMLQGQAKALKLVYGHVESMAVKCAVELGVPDMIQSYGSPMSLSQIAAEIKPDSAGGGEGAVDTRQLARLMRYLVYNNFFCATICHVSGQTLYGLTNTSRWLLSGVNMSLAPLLLFASDPMVVNPFHELSGAIRNGEVAFEMHHKGRNIFEVASTNPGFNKQINNGMACTSEMIAKAILSVYKNGFQGIQTLVDVGGGTGYFVTEIVKAHSPHIKGINFDLPHVVSDNPSPHPAVTHIGGSMFDSIPCADAVIFKFVLHQFGDEDCLKILRNCKESMPATGKIMLIEMVLQPQSAGLFDDTVSALDLIMMVSFPSGKERTQAEWTRLLEDAGFSRCAFFKVPTLVYIIEAYAS